MGRTKGDLTSLRSRLTDRAMPLGASGVPLISRWTKVLSQGTWKNPGDFNDFLAFTRTTGLLSVSAPCFPWLSSGFRAMLGTTLSRPESWRAKHWPVPYLHRRAVSLKGLVFWAVCGVGACVVAHYFPHSVKELLTSYLTGKTDQVAEALRAGVIGEAMSPGPQAHDLCLPSTYQSRDNGSVVRVLADTVLRGDVKPHFFSPVFRADELRRDRIRPEGGTAKATAVRLK